MQSLGNNRANVEDLLTQLCHRQSIQMRNVHSVTLSNQFDLMRFKPR